jgi:hypothetical protein
VRVIMTGLDWKSKFTSAVIRPYFEGMGAQPERHLRGKLWSGLIPAANPAGDPQGDERANAGHSPRRYVRY